MAFQGILKGPNQERHESAARSALTEVKGVLVARTFMKSPAEQLHFDALPPETRAAFLRCTELPFLMENEWYLAGGTALSLQVGHRQSVDLDFFTHARSINERRISEQFAEAGTWETTSLAPGTVYGEFMEAKVSLISYPYFQPADPMLSFGSVEILAPRDIAAMKVTAISQRGRKRDFFDLYWLSRNVLRLSESLARVERQYSVRQNRNHVLKSLVYFDDAESDPDQTLYFKATWTEVKDYFEQEVARIAAKVLGMP